MSEVRNSPFNHLKSLQEIGDYNFTPREISLFAAYVSGRSVKSTGALLGIAPKTVETHTRNILIKTGWGSREDMIRFIEKSGKYNDVKAHYEDLMVWHGFEVILKEIKKVLPHTQECTVYYEDSASFKCFKEVLKILGVPCRVTEHGPLLHMGKGGGIEIKGETFGFYPAVFALINDLYPEVDLAPFEKDFAELSKGFTNREAAAPEPVQKKAMPVRWMHAMVVVALVVGCFGLWSLLPSTPDFQVRSDLETPHQTTFLERSHVTQKMKETLEGQSGLRMVALVGMGGSGKTTLSRQFAKMQKDPIVWEINAENKETVLQSFRDLLEALARTKEERQNLRAFYDIKDQKTRERKLLQTIKEYLRAQKSWTLIYDNVGSLSAIRDYFPRDASIWGEGTIIVTTRNTNIQTSALFPTDSVIQLSTLDNEEKYNLFKVIVHGKKAIPEEERSSIVQFLEKIPPFPLDVSTAAYYIKGTETPLAAYIKMLEEKGAQFDKVQASLLKELGTYDKTRYGVITVSLQKLINTDPAFGDLLLFVSLLDSQRIPKDLLFKYKPAPVVDQFVYALKRHSFISAESQGTESLAFSLHRSVHSISYHYLTKTIENIDKKLEPIAALVKEYTEDIVEQGTQPLVVWTHSQKIRLKEQCRQTKDWPLVLHLKSMIGHLEGYDQKASRRLKRVLGQFYLNIGFYPEAIDIFLDYLKTIKLQTLTDHRSYGKGLYYLSRAYHDVGRLEDAYKTIKEAIKVFEDHSLTEGTCYADALVSLGASNRKKEKYEEALTNISRAEEIYQNYYKKDHLKFLFAWAHKAWIYRYKGDYKKAQDTVEVLAHSPILNKASSYAAYLNVRLGSLYKRLGEYDKAATYNLKGLKLYEKLFGANYHGTCWARIKYAGILYVQRKYRKALSLMNKSTPVYAKNFPPDHTYMGWVMIQKGRALSRLGRHEEGIQSIEEGLRVTQKHVNKNHTLFALKSLGKALARAGEFEKADEVLQKTLDETRKVGDADTFKVLEAMAGLEMMRSEKEKDSVVKAERHEKARSYLKEALTYIEKIYHPNSAHYKRARSKLEKIPA